MSTNGPHETNHDQQGKPNRPADAFDQAISSDDSLDLSEKGLTVDDTTEATARDILFYPEEVEVEKSSTDSA